MPILQILHLSDIHLAENHRAFRRKFGFSVYEPDVLKAIAEIVHWWHDKIDAIVISGDIADLGTARELRRAAEFFNLPNDLHSKEPWLSSKRKPTIQAFTKPIILVPGNHDRFLNFSGIPRSSLFDNFFSSYWKVGVGGIQSYIIPNEETPILGIICADFSLHSIRDITTIGGHWGQGRIYGRRLNNLVSETNRIKSTYPACAIIWMLHFAPKFEDYYDLSENMRLADSDYFINAAEQAGIKYIFCGHTHRNKDYSVGSINKVFIYCAGTSACRGSNEDTTIHLRKIEIKDGKIAKMESCNFRWRADQQIFL